MIFATPELTARDQEVLSDIAEMRDRLAGMLRLPRRWQGNLRRSLQARAIRGSNTIEGYAVTQQDAVAAVDDESPLLADAATWAEITGYRRVLTFIINHASTPDFHIDSQTLRIMHYMLLEHDLVGSSAGSFRATDIYVRDSRDDRVVYRGPAPELVPELVDELMSSLVATDAEPLVAGAMAHLNLVMIHPFRDGNGRMARALQTVVLARERTLSPEFLSIEEWLGHNTDDYYTALASVGQGEWRPERDASSWVRFCLRAHHMQAQTVRRRLDESAHVWTMLDELQATQQLPDPALDALYDAFLGARITRSGYAKQAGLDATSATRHLKQLAAHHLLIARGETRGRHYVMGPALRAVRDEITASRKPLEDPYPSLMQDMRTQ